MNHLKLAFFLCKQIMFDLSLCSSCRPVFKRKVWAIRPWSYNTQKLVIRPPFFLNSNTFTTNILVLPYYIQRFIKQKSLFIVGKLAIKKKWWSYNQFLCS